MNPDILVFFIYLGGITLQFINCYSGGNFDDEQIICQTMKVHHEGALPQDSEPPFIVEPDSIMVSNSDVGKLFEVSLLATIKTRSFRGFMLEARRSDSVPPEGTFTVLDTYFSRLQTCNGIAGKAVTQTNNQQKTDIQVRWSASEPGEYYFRATFLESYTTFWHRKIFSHPTPAPTFTPYPVTLPLETISTTATSTLPTQAPTFTPYPVTLPLETISTTATSTLPTQGPTTPSSKPHLNVPMTLLLLSFLNLTMCVPFLIKPRKLVWIKVISAVSLGLSLAAFIILLIQSRVIHSIVTGFAVALNLCQTILIFCFCGPSHELRKIFCWVLRLDAFVNVCFTTAAIFVGLEESKKSCYWLPVMMGVYLAFQLLLYVIFIYDEVKQNNWLQTAVLGKRVSWWHVSLIFRVVNIVFTAALLSGIYLCGNE